MDWNETKMIIMEVEKLFNRGDDLRDAWDIKKMQQEIDIHHTNCLKDAKVLIKELTNIIAVKESEIMAPTESIHSTQIEKLQLDKENISNQIIFIQQNIDSNRETTMKLASESLKIRQQMVEIGEQNSIAETRTLYALSLYNKITSITWNFNDNRRGTLCGSIDIPSKHEIKNFDIEVEALTPYEVANKLWDLIEYSQ